MLKFNFQYIKNLASPGVWRRGYDYYQKNQVEKVDLCEEGIYGKVKGNFRDEYTTKLSFFENEVRANCDCPFPDEWCKHAVAVALIGISNGLWNKFWGIEEITTDEESEDVEYQGNYRFIFNEKSKPKTISLKVVERKSDKTISQIEPILRSVVEAQKRNILQLNDKEKVEFQLLSFIFKHGQFDKNRQHYYINYRQLNDIMPLITHLEEFRHAITKKKIKIETNPLKLILSVNISKVGNVLVALHWKRTNPDDLIPYEEIRLFAKRVQWGLYRNAIFPIETSVGELPYFLSKSSFMDIRGGDGGKFLFEQLPVLKKDVEGQMLIEEADLVKEARLEPISPKEVLVIEMPDEETIRVALEFDYGGKRVSYTDFAKESPYVCVVKGAPPPKQYSIEQFREQEAAQLQADIEAGIVDPADIEKKKKKVIRVTVLNKDKIGVKLKNVKGKAPNKGDSVNIFSEKPSVLLNEDDLFEYFEPEIQESILSKKDGLLDEIEERKDEIPVITQSYEVSSPQEYKEEERSQDTVVINQVIKPIVENDKVEKIIPKKNNKQVNPSKAFDSFVDDLASSVNPVNILSQELVVKKKPSKHHKHKLVEDVDLMDKLFSASDIASKPAKSKTRPPKKANFSMDSIDETITSNEGTEPLEQHYSEEPEDVYWIKRDKEVEKKAYKRLLNCGLMPMQTNKFEAKGDNVIDFIGKHFDTFVEEWDVEYPEEISRIRIADNPFRFKVDIDFEDGLDYFLLNVMCAVGNKDIELDSVQEILRDGKKYVYTPGEGYAEIPIADLLQLTKTLNSFDAGKITETKFRAQTFKVGLIAELIDQGAEIIMSERFKHFWELVSSFSDFSKIDLPSDIKAELRDYQKKGYAWLYFLYTYGLNGILADDMGLGKTLQALTLLKKAKQDKGSRPSLIICPTSVVFNWEDEIEKFTPDLKKITYTGAGRHSLRKLINSNDVIITSYAILRRDFEALKKYHFRYIILDESQKIKNFQSLTASASKQLHSDHRLALSGTPIENRLSELWSVFDFLMPRFLYDYNEFKQRYSSPIEDYNNKDAERRLKKQVYPFILRRLKQNVAKDLPDKLEFIQYCEMLPEQQDIYIDILNSTREELFRKIERDGIAKSQMSILSALLRLRQVCCHPKLIGDVHDSDIRVSGKFDQVKEMIKEVTESGHRVLLFSQFVQMLDIIKAWLEQEGIKHEYLTGSTKDRKERVHRFNNDESIPIFLISLKAGGTGLNLTGADYVIHYDPWWNPAVEDQATDRAHRIGQTKKVFVYRLITKGTVEEKIIKLQEKKRDLIDNVLTVDTSLGKLLTYDDIREIFTPDF